MLTTKKEVDKIYNAIHESLWFECDKCKGEYLKEHLALYSTENGLYCWELCETCEYNINSIVIHNINPCSTCVIKGVKA